MVSSGDETLEKIELSYPIIDRPSGSEILFCFANFSAIIAKKSSLAIIPSGIKFSSLNLKSEDRILSISFSSYKRVA